MSEIYDIQFMQKHISGYHKSNVLITGATGFLGSWMAKALDSGCNRLFYCNHEYLNYYLDGDVYNYIFHFAPTPIEPIIECAKRSNAKVLYASSGAVYGGLEEKVSESSPTNPKTDYGYEKLRCETVLRKSGLEYCNARLFTFCGTNMKNQFAITAFVDAVKNSRPLVTYGNPTRSYMYIVDAVVWLAKLMLADNGVYNVGSEKETTIRKLAQRVASFRIPKGEVIESDKEFIQNANYYVPDCSKAHELGLEQHFSLNYGIERMME